jgi:hypothetical protein
MNEDALDSFGVGARVAVILLGAQLSNDVTSGSWPFFGAESGQLLVPALSLVLTLPSFGQDGGPKLQATNQRHSLQGLRRG